jgi:NADH:ubiquinone oxidoreductase subunit
MGINYPKKVNYNLWQRSHTSHKNGAIAAWSPTGISVARGHEYLDRGFFDAIFA